MRGARFLPPLVALVCAAGIAWVQPVLAARTRKIHFDNDVSALPPADKLRALSFGYHAAGADLVWASLIVEHGVRTAEKRPFSAAPRYVEAIIALDPKHALIYDFVDSLLIYKPIGVATEEDARLTRAFLERGTRERTHDHKLWFHYGQYLAFLGPNFLPDPQEGESWRRDGAFAMAHAIDIGADADRTLTVSTLLGQAGEKKAQIEHLQRTWALTDNPDTRHQIEMKLRSLNTTVVAGDVVEAVETEWHARFPFVTRGTALLLGPHRDPALCAGVSASSDPRCASDWKATIPR